MAIVKNTNIEDEILLDGLDALIAEGTLKAMFLNPTHTVDDSTQDFIDDVSANEIGVTSGSTYVAGGVTPANVSTSIVGGVIQLDCDDFSITGHDSAADGDVNYIIFYVDTGTPSTSKIIAQDTVTQTTLATGDTFTYNVAAGGFYNIS